MNNNISFKHPGGVVAITDGDYFLTDGSGWFEYNGLAIRLRHDEASGSMDVSAYHTGHEDDAAIFQMQIRYEEQ